MSIILACTICIGYVKQFTATQYMHRITFMGKKNLQGASSVQDSRNMCEELNVLFDTGAFDDFVDCEVAEKLFDILPSYGRKSLICGILIDGNNVAHGSAVIMCNTLDLTMQMGTINQLEIQGTKIDVIVGVPTMCKWGLVFDATDVGISMKIVTPVVVRDPIGVTDRESEER